MKFFNALLIGIEVELILPSLLNRASFNVDVITTNPVIKHSKFIKNFKLVSKIDEIYTHLDSIELELYDFIIPCDDYTIKHILDSNLDINKKLRILPIQKSENLKHLCSKIKLSKILLNSPLNTPEFIIADGLEETIKAAEYLNYPVMIKVDYETGGIGVFECNNLNDLNNINKSIFNKKLLVQKKIIGKDLDLSAIYRDGKLIHFSYSTFKKTVSHTRFGPSILREYTQLSNINKNIFKELQILGKILGANGSINITCILSESDDKRYFIEADMRPNAWVDFSKFLGDDTAIKIFNYFNKQIIFTPPIENNNYPQTLLLPYFHRMDIHKILLNNHKVWKYLPKEEPNLLLNSTVKKIILPI